MAESRVVFRSEEHVRGKPWVGELHVTLVDQAKIPAVNRRCVEESEQILPSDVERDSCE